MNRFGKPHRQGCSSHRGGPSEGGCGREGSQDPDTGSCCRLTTAVKSTWPIRGVGDQGLEQGVASASVSEMTKSFGSLLRERREVKKSLNGKFRETETKAPLGFSGVCYCRRSGPFVRGPGSQASAAEAPNFTFTPRLVTPGVPMPCMSSLVPWWQ